MDETLRNMREAQFRLSRLMETDSRRHTVIETGRPSPPTVVELYAGSPHYLKIECPVGSPAPLAITLMTLRSEHGQTGGLEVYGSFRDKEPGPKKYEDKYRNPKRMEVKDPFGRREFGTVKVAKKGEPKGRDKK